MLQIEDGRCACTMATTDSLDAQIESCVNLATHPGMYSFSPSSSITIPVTPQAINRKKKKKKILKIWQM